MYDIPFTLTKDSLLYEDEYLLILNKPALFPVEPTIVKDRNNLYYEAQKYLFYQTRSLDQNSQTEPYIGMHHRLDHHTSGVILFTKDKSINPSIHSLFKDHKISKTYQALCYAPGGLYKKSTPIKNQSFTIQNKMGRVSPKTQQGKWGILPEGEQAETNVLVLERVNLFFLIQAQPLTGRTHQIRVHLSSIQLPILGDPIYGGLQDINNEPIKRTMLHAQSLSFTHPLSLQNLTIKAPYPQDFIALADKLNIPL